ncbi:hypothetical protein MMC10_003698 [Thelotrema lepadinum]|nr:hypothetical protein [Thelotrema lepadinum]
MPVPSSQNVTSPAFSGSVAEAHQLQAKIRFNPDASLLHQDGGNTGSQDYPGPLGSAPVISSAAEQINVLLWGSDGSLTSAYVLLTNTSSLQYGLAALDPTTLEVLATWFPPEENQVLGYAYMALELQSNSITVPSKQGHIYVVSRQECNGSPELVLQRDIDLTSTISSGEQLLNSLNDAEGNIWFTTGGIIGAGDPEQATSTIGYITADDTIHTQHFQNQMVENGIAVNGTNMYVVTGPSGAAYNQTNATGYMYAFTTGSGSADLTTLWSAPYSAGSRLKTNGYARGSGSTPGLLGDQYVTITDNSDEQISLIVYNLAPAATASGSASQVYCTVPLFQPNASANEIGPTIHWDGTTYGIAIENAWAFPPAYKPGVDSIDGDFNNMTVMAPGISRIDVNSTGCTMRWEADLRVKSVPVLSTATGLYYGYTQDVDLAVEGEYAWYFVALDWDSGDEVWRIKAGAGGTYNDVFYVATLGPDGSLYQGILAGYVIVRDAEGGTL